jgi:hypothetical protein
MENTTPEIEFAVQIINTSYHEYPLVCVKSEGLSTFHLKRAISQWGEILSTHSQKITSDEIFKTRDPWFGFGVDTYPKILTERETLTQITEPQLLESTVVNFIETIIAYNKPQEDQILYTHEELETGTDSILWLLKRNIDFLNLYIRFLKSIDLEHTVAQVDTIFALSKIYTPQQVKPLLDFTRSTSASILNIWLENDRAWKE